MWFDDWNSLEQIAAKSIIGFAVVVLLLRIAGNRSVAKLNAFDLVLVFTVGSILATTILNNGTTITEGGLALAMLVGLQWLTAWSATRWPGFRTLIKSQPVLLAYDGALLPDNMRRARVAEIEILATLRQHGVATLAEVQALVLESEGDISVLKRGSGDATAQLRQSGMNVPAGGGKL